MTTAREIEHSKIMMSTDTVVGLLDVVKDQQESIMHMEARLCAYMLVFKHMVMPEIRDRSENLKLRAQRLDVLVNLVNGVYPKLADGIADANIREYTLEEIHRLNREICGKADGARPARLTVLKGGKSLNTIPA